MEPELSEGDRLLVDTARRVPATGEMFVLWDGDGLVVKRVERVHADGGAPAGGCQQPHTSSPARTSGSGCLVVPARARQGCAG